MRTVWRPIVQQDAHRPLLTNEQDRHHSVLRQRQRLNWCESLIVNLETFGSGEQESSPSEYQSGIC